MMTDVAMGLVATIMGGQGPNGLLQAKADVNDRFQKLLDREVGQQHGLQNATTRLPDRQEQMARWMARQTQITEKKLNGPPKEFVPEGLVSADLPAVIEQLMANLDAWVVTLLDNLDLTQEELHHALVDLNMTVVDLFDQTGLQTLLKAIQGMDAETDLFSHTDFLEQLKTIYKQLEIQLSEMGLTQEMVQKVLETPNQGLENLNLGLLHHPLQMDEPIQSERVSVLEHQVIEEPIATNVVKVEAGSEQNLSQNTNPDLNQNTNHPQMHTFNPIFEQVVTEQTTTIHVGNFEQVITEQVTVQEIFNQIVAKVQVAHMQDTTTLSFQLKPQSLGNIAFSVSHEQGILTGNFVAENQNVKELIEQNLSHLKASLNLQGIKVEDIKVVVGSANAYFNQEERSGRQQHQAQKRQKHLKGLETLNGVVDIAEEMERMAIEKMQKDLLDYSVAYQA